MLVRRLPIRVLLNALLVGLVVALGLRLWETSTWPHDSMESRREQADPRPVIQIAQVLRALKLITVEIHTSINSESLSESWRGDVRASVRVPVTYYYGIELENFSPDDLVHNSLSGGIVLRVPAPVRLATQIEGEQALEGVRVSGLRLRDVGGEYHLGLARSRVYELARDARLTPGDEQMLSLISRQQIERLLRTLNIDLAAAAPVEIIFKAQHIEMAP